MAMGAGPQRGVKADINVTPLVDVVLVLLIIFMVVTPLLQRGREVALPKARSSEKDDARTSPLILSVTADRKIWIDQDPHDDEQLEERLIAELKARPSRKLLLKGDRSLEYGEVRRVMDLARKAGAKSVSLAVEELR